MEVASSADPGNGLCEGPLQVPRLTLDRDWPAFAEAKCLSKATAKRWLPVLRSFENHLGRSDLATLTPDDVKSWVMSRLEGGTSNKTVVGVHVLAITTFIAWASSENRIDKSTFFQRNHDGREVDAEA